MNIRSQLRIMNAATAIIAIALLAGCSYLKDVKMPTLPSSAPVSIEVHQPTFTPVPTQPASTATPTAAPVVPTATTVEVVAVEATPVPIAVVEPQNAFWAVTSEQAILFENRTIPAGEPYETNVELGEVAQAAFTVYSLKEVQFKVVAPNGQVIDPAFVSAYPNYGSLNASASTPNGPEGRTYQYIINAPQEGVWKLSVSAESTTPVGMIASINSPLMLRFNFDKGNYVPGDKVRLEANIEYRGAVIKRGTTINAALVMPDGTRQAIELADNRRNGDNRSRDGVYTSVFDVPSNIPVDKPYVTIEIAGTFKGSTRKVFASLPVIPAGISLGRIAEVTTDKDGDNLIDTLTMSVTLNVARAGNYGVKGVLYSADGKELGNAVFSSSQSKLILEKGEQTITLNYEGRFIRQLQADGPFKLDVSIFDENNSNFQIVNLPGAYTSSALKSEQFESPNLKVEAGKENTIDTNKNGKFDELRISLSLSFVNKGEYKWEAKLVDEAGNPIETITGSGQLDTNTPLLLTFTGKKIRISKQDGPYTLQNVLITQIGGAGASAGADLFQNVYTTKPYKNTQFESAGL